MIVVELVSPGGVVTVRAEDGESWNARLAAGIWEAEDGLIAEADGRFERVPFESLRAKEEMLKRLRRAPSEYLEEGLQKRLIRHVLKSGYYVAED